MIKFTQSLSKPTQVKVDLLVILAYEQTKKPLTEVDFLPNSLRQELAKLMAKTKFSGKTGTMLEMTTHGKISAPLVLILGLGKVKLHPAAQLEAVRSASALAQQIAKKFQAKKIGLVLPTNLLKADLTVEVGAAISTGIILSQYTFKKYQKPSPPTPLITEVVVFSNENKLKTGFIAGELTSQGVLLARDLVNEPAGRLAPIDLLKVAQKIARQAPSIMLKKLGQAELTRQRFGGILAVSQGSPHEPFLIHLTYKPTAPKQRKIALLGKGITFDSGGINLKPSDYMGNMKTDMAGAAAVLGLFSIIARLKPDCEVHGIIPTCENMPGGSALKPGDIITMKNGLHVEVANTDAEGRIILADALTYTMALGVNQIVDLATLTGACIAALGDNIAGLMSNNRQLTAELMAASKVTGEQLWPLPLPKIYRETIKSDVADLRNISAMKGGGALTAGLFLQKFVGKTCWAHLDIAGPCWAEKKVNEYTDKGAVGFGVRTLVEYLLNSKSKITSSK